MAWHNILKENFHHYIDRLFNELLLVCNKSNASVSEKDERSRGFCLVGKSFVGEDMLCCFTRFREQSFFIIFTFYVEPDKV